MSLNLIKAVVDRNKINLNHCVRSPFMLMSRCLDKPVLREYTHIAKYIWDQLQNWSAILSWKYQLHCMQRSIHYDETCHIVQMSISVSYWNSLFQMVIRYVCIDNIYSSAVKMHALVDILWGSAVETKVNKSIIPLDDFNIHITNCENK